MSQQTFSVGEIAIIIGDCPLRFFGDEVTVTKGLGDHLAWVPQHQACEMIHGYEIAHPAFATRGVVRPHALRKKRPPQDWAKLANLTDVPRETEVA